MEIFQQNIKSLPPHLLAARQLVLTNHGLQHLDKNSQNLLDMNICL